jgi:hypothetical protein
MEKSDSANSSASTLHACENFLDYWAPLLKSQLMTQCSSQIQSMLFRHYLTLDDSHVVMQSPTQGIMLDVLKRPGVTLKMTANLRKAQQFPRIDLVWRD